MYGVTPVFDDDSQGITIYYLKYPDEITATTDELEIDQVWDEALKYFVTGMALRDNKDTQDRQVGSDELTIFGSLVQKAVKDAKEDFIGTRTQFNSHYNAGF